MQSQGGEKTRFQPSVDKTLEWRLVPAVFLGSVRLVVVVGAVVVVVEVAAEEHRASGEILGLYLFLLRSRQSFFSVEDHPPLCFL